MQYACSLNVCCARYHDIMHVYVIHNLVKIKVTKRGSPEPETIVKHKEIKEEERCHVTLLYFDINGIMKMFILILQNTSK